MPLNRFREFYIYQVKKFHQAHRLVTTPSVLAVAKTIVFETLRQ